MMSQSYRVIFLCSRTWHNTYTHLTWRDMIRLSMKSRLSQSFLQSWHGWQLEMMPLSALILKLCLMQCQVLRLPEMNFVVGGVVMSLGQTSSWKD